MSLSTRLDKSVGLFAPGTRLERARSRVINGMKSRGKKRDNLGSIGKDF